MSDRAVRTIDLFAGAGGLTEGFRQAGFQCLFANDHEKPALETFKRNHPGVLTSDSSIEQLDAAKIREQLGLRRGELDLIAGGPPCQGFSTYGQRDTSDHRNQLYKHYFRFVEEYRPAAFCIENVLGLLSMEGGAIVADMCGTANALGYSAKVHVLDACDYGVPQRRKRVFILGSRSGEEVLPPQPTHSVASGQDDFFCGGVSPYVTVRDAISDLPRDAYRPKDTHRSRPYEGAATTPYQRDMRDGSSEIHNHSAKQMLGIRHLRMALMHPGDYGADIEQRLSGNGLPEEAINRLMYGGGMIRDLDECRKEDRAKELELRALLSSGNTTTEQLITFMDMRGFANKYRRLRWDDCSHTLVAHMARDCSDFVHPNEDRFITVREAARLQSFPDAYYFVDSQFQQFRQIGNAVPPLLGKHVGIAVARHFQGALRRAS